jgi:membrane-associated phospholipid phosphatase
VVTKYFLLFLFSLCTASSFAQKEDARNFFRAGKDLFSFSSRLDNKDFNNFAAVTAATGIGFILDEPVKTFTQNNKTRFLNNLAEMDRYYHIETISIAAISLYGYGWLADKSEPRELGLKLTESVVYSMLLNLSVKAVIGRGRPFLEKGCMSFSPFNFDFETTSFPSGHTTLAFAFSTVMAAEYDNLLWKTAWFTAAALVGGARIYHNVHWFSDVIMGAAIGYFVGDFVNNHSTNNKKSETRQLPVLNFKIAL